MSNDVFSICSVCRHTQNRRVFIWNRKKQISTEKWTSRDDTVTTNVTEMLTYTILSSPVTTTAKNTVTQEKARRYRFSAVLWVETLGRSGRHRGGRLAMRSDWTVAGGKGSISSGGGYTRGED